MKLRAALFLICFLPGVPLSGLVAQGSIRSSLDISAAAISFPTATEADYDAGSVSASSPIVATIDATRANGGQASVQRTSTLSIRATSTILGGSKPVGDLQWQRNATSPGGWIGLTTVDAVVESRQVIFDTLNDPWSATVYFRTLLSWANDPPGSYSAVVVFTLTIATP